MGKGITVEKQQNNNKKIFTVTAFEIDQNKNQNRSIEYFQNLGKER